MTVWIVEMASGEIIAVYSSEGAARAAAPDHGRVTMWPVRDDPPMSPEVRDRLRAQYGAELHKP